MQKICQQCKNSKDLDEFAFDKRKKDGKQIYCRVCKALIDKNRREIHKDKLNKKQRDKLVIVRDLYEDFKKQYSCSKCNESRYYLIEFHHIDPKTKKFNISDVFKFKQERFLLELEKCVPLCVSCHREFHHFEKKRGMNIKDYLKILVPDQESKI